MGFQVLEYDADQIRISIAGVAIAQGAGVSGFADGEFLSLGFKPQFTLVKGTDGSATRSKTNDRETEIKINLMQSSSVNAILSALLMADVSTPNGTGIGSFVVADLQGTTLVSVPTGVDHATCGHDLRQRCKGALVAHHRTLGRRNRGRQLGPTRYLCRMSGKRFDLLFSDAVTVAPGVAFVKDPKTGVRTQHKVIDIACVQTAPSRVSQASLTTEEARDLAAELVAAADIIDHPPAPAEAPAHQPEPSGGHEPPPVGAEGHLGGEHV